MSHEPVTKPVWVYQPCQRCAVMIRVPLGKTLTQPLCRWCERKHA